jgi:hypothetical protein
MTTTQRPRPQRPASPAPNPASRGVILVAVAVVLGVILLIKGGGVGFDTAETDLTIESGEEQTTIDEVTTTTEAEASPTSVAPAALKVVALNGAGINGYAGAAQQFLSVAGYTDTSAATAATQTATTIVYYAPGFDADAAAIASLFGLELSAVQPLPEGTSLARDAAEFPADTNVAVWLGPDVQNTVEGAGGGTTTTIAGATATTTTTTG